MCAERLAPKGATEPWTEQRVPRKLEEYMVGATEWPSYREFQRAGRQFLRDKVTHLGGARLWEERLWLPYPERKPVQRAGQRIASARDSRSFCGDTISGRADSSSKEPARSRRERIELEPAQGR